MREACHISWRDATFPKGVVIGCDDAQKDLLKWWLDNYSRHNQIPVTFVDMGKTPLDPELKSRFASVVSLVPVGDKSWFAKPLAILESPAQRTLWLDLDCEVLGSLGDLFQFEMPYLAIRQDVPYARNTGWMNKHIVSGATVYNGGVIAVDHGNPLIIEWANACLANAKLPQDDLKHKRGDQEILSNLIFEGQWANKIHIHELDQRFNNLRLEGRQTDAVIFHHTGKKKEGILRD